jgi:hypothetical protein
MVDSSERLISSLTISGQTGVSEGDEVSDPPTRIQKRFFDLGLVHWYINIMVDKDRTPEPIKIERVQTGVRMEKRLLKVLKAVAELKDLTLGDLLEGIVLHAFENKTPFSPETLKAIEKLKELYGLTLTADQSHTFEEIEP